MSKINYTRKSKKNCMCNSKKAQGLPITTLIIVVLAMVVLVILIYIGLKAREGGKIAGCEGVIPNAKCLTPSQAEDGCPPGSTRKVMTCSDGTKPKENYLKAGIPAGICCVPDSY
ncbi:hypothetical protein HOK51_10105 [Candidatus Woesearchaeota archaeon]|jgi:hypothetical protein|nr:hypothetical protein [Candidatus Woesearchaeota archaeon]MBT6520177.1 hypothetical protein [Candidatus Woesearchaeota archaeon]MBT7367197.1 hypothetical protein [Candidatus Woesearchaeota archaeon]